MSIRSLAHTIIASIRKGRDIVTAYELPYQDTTSPPLFQLLRVMYYLSLDVRKLLLDACRIQVPIRQNETLFKSYTALGDYRVVLPKIPWDHSSPLEEIELDTICDWFDEIHESPITCSILSYFVRAETTEHVQEFKKQVKVGIDKEIGKALSYHNHTQNLDYRSLFLPQKAGPFEVHPGSGIYPKKLPLQFEAGVQRIKNHFSSVHTMPILPYYNGKKNVGWTTQENYYRIVKILVSKNSVQTTTT